MIGWVIGTIIGVTLAALITILADPCLIGAVGIGVGCGFVFSTLGLIYDETH